MIDLKSKREIEIIRDNGKIVADTLRFLGDRMRSGMETIELDALAEKFIKKHNAIPAFKNYRGFPRPDYDSGWVPIDGEEVITLTHGLGGNVDNYVVDLQFKDTVAYGIHCIWYGGIAYGTTTNGGNYRGLDTNKVDIKRLGSDAYCEEMRIRIWVYN